MLPRSRELLHEIVAAYIETGEPVASRSIARRRGDTLSAASVRNVMADLDEEGYLHQPHTSAGRIPTEEAFRSYAGWTLEQVRRELSARLEQASATYDEILRKLTLLYSKGLLDIVSTPEVHMEGASNLVGLDLHLTKEKMRELFRALEEKKRVLELVDRFLENQAGEIGVQEVPENPGPDGEPVQDVTDSIAALASERDQLTAEKAEMQDRFLRAQAEFQNYRKRAEKERLDFAEYASTEAVRALLPVIDDFERALKAESADREFKKGMELIHQRLYEALKKLGLEPLESIGRPFDPHLQHAVEMVETE